MGSGGGIYMGNRTSRVRICTDRRANTGHDNSNTQDDYDPVCGFPEWFCHGAHPENTTADAINIQLGELFTYLGGLIHMDFEMVFCDPREIRAIFSA
jgi:hypothetical protein